MVGFGCFLVCAVVASGRSVTTAELEEHFELARRMHVTCGPISAWYSLRRLGHELDADEVVRRAKLTDKGIRGTDLLDLLASFGVPAEALHGRPESVSELAVPSILLLEDHCVVYEGYDLAEGEVRVFDPLTRGIRTGTIGELAKAWKGDAIVFSPPRAAANWLADIGVIAAIDGALLLAFTIFQWRVSVARRQGAT